ncbi:hypothetical protein G4B88_021063 [Cannabis sativa]|uniref:Uncharacterized protein n=1 Tax=Cannabis sativa TaxID=3483 RepID=A0A7J6HYC2_CANSA|nr:hypothetical protein G4B88_021063 [Cannabis sativa]
MLVRVSGDNIMMSPPFIMSPEELEQLISIYGKALKATEERVKELKSQQKERETGPARGLGSPRLLGSWWRWSTEMGLLVWGFGVYGFLRHLRRKPLPFRLNERVSSSTAEVKQSKGYKGHGMLAPFTAGWQSTETEPLVIEKSEGSYVYDINGKKYLDALAGLWCTVLGGNEPRLVAAATEQMNTLPFYHSFWNRTTKPSLVYIADLAKELLEVFTARKMAKVFFTNSGSDANDTQVKLVCSSNLRFCILTDETEEEYSTRLANNLESLILNEGPDTIAAFIAEPVMGAGGVILPPKTYFEKVCIFSHGFTYSGHPVSCAVAIEVLKIFKERNLVEQVNNISPRFQDGLKAFSNSPIIGEIRGTGLVLGTEFTDNKSPNNPFPPEWGKFLLPFYLEQFASKVVLTNFQKFPGIGSYFGAECVKNGMFVRVSGDNVAMAPPFIISPEEVDEIIRIYGKALKSTEERVKELKSKQT